MWGWFLAFVIFVDPAGSFVLNPSAFAFLVIGIGAPSSVIAGIIADKYGRSKTTVIILTISGTCSILIGFAVEGPEWLFVLVACIWGMTVIADSAQFWLSLQKLHHRHSLGQL